MSLSVVIPTFNDRDDLVPCLDGLANRTSDVEIIVVNGPSTDGTSGMIHERTDVDVLLESAARNLNVARNAGFREAKGSIVALLSPTYRVEGSWQRTIETQLSGAADGISGPLEPIDGDDEAVDRYRNDDGLAIHGGNVALTRGAITALDGFDEYLTIDGIADLAQRLSGLGLHVVWHPEMRVQLPAAPDGGRKGRSNGGHGGTWRSAGDADWGLRYRSMTYREIKNGGLHPAVIARILGSTIRDGGAAARDVVRGRGTPTQWVGNGVDVLSNVTIGGRDGIRARREDGTPAKNPNGLSRSDTDAAVAARHDWR